MEVVVLLSILIGALILLLRGNSRDADKETELLKKPLPPIDLGKHRPVGKSRPRGGAMPPPPTSGGGLKPSDKIDHAPPPPIPASMKLKGRAYVIDGDTIVIQKIKIRLAGIDAPELDQPWGQKSKWAMVRICKGQTISVELTGETSYDRLVGTCYLPDGRDIGAEIIKEGLALDGGYYSEGKYRHLEQPGMRAKLIRYGHRGKRS